MLSVHRGAAHSSGFSRGYQLDMVIHPLGVPFSRWESAELSPDWYLSGHFQNF